MHDHIYGHCSPAKLTYKINHNTLRDAIIQENSLPSFPAFSKALFKAVKTSWARDVWDWAYGNDGNSRCEPQNSRTQRLSSSFRRGSPPGSPLLWQEKGIIRLYPPLLQNDNLHQHQLLSANLEPDQKWADHLQACDLSTPKTMPE